MADINMLEREYFVIFLFFLLTDREEGRQETDSCNYLHFSLLVIAVSDLRNSRCSINVEKHNMATSFSL